MTEKAKNMGRIEYGLGAYFLALVGSYLIPGINPTFEFILTGVVIIATYFGHWAMTEVSLELAERRIMRRLKDEREAAREIRYKRDPEPSPDSGEDPRPVH